MFGRRAMARTAATLQRPEENLPRRLASLVGELREAFDNDLRIYQLWFSDGKHDIEVCQVARCYLGESDAKQFADTYNRLMASMGDTRQVTPVPFLAVQEDFCTDAFCKEGGAS